VDNRLIPAFKKWDKYPPRAVKWAQHTFPMELNVIYTFAETDSSTEPSRKGYVQILKKHRKEYWQFLKDNKIEPTLYDKTLGNYSAWLQFEAE
jgi:hypothetical protein